MHDLKYKIYFYTEGEFLEMLEEIVNATSKDKSLKGKKLEKYLDTLVDHFIKITEHPKKGDLIFYPNSPEDGKPENILKIVKEWRQFARIAFDSKIQNDSKQNLSPGKSHVLVK